MTNEYFSNFNITNFSSNGKFPKFLLEILEQKCYWTPRDFQDIGET